MATIPIEVIVQDAESPVDPTPVGPTDSGDNTNITIPDTGAGIVNSNSGINNSSAAISIVSIIIAVLAIGAVIALLARRYYKRKNLNTETGMTHQEKRAMAATSTIAVLALTVLLGQLVVVGVVSPIATNAATDDTVSDEAELDVDSKITIIATRTEDKNTAVATVKNTSTATSHQVFGYKVTASMEADATTANLYLDGDETSEYYIAPVVDGTLSDNTWGYTLEEESEDYLSIPLATDPAIIVKGNDNIEDELVDIYYTIQVDKDLPTGTYTGTLEYILTNNNFPSTLTTMQGMTTEICENTFTPGNQTTDPVPTATLRDTRDDKTYTIAKLSDGNCWMTQNLDLDLNSQVALTPENTNISANWTPANSTISFTGTTVDGWQNDNNVPYSADPGELYIYSSGDTSNDTQYTSLVDCQAAHPDCSIKNHAGNYYNWSAAVASSDTSDITKEFSNAPDSICPAGWRLPVDRNAESMSEGNEFNTLIISQDGIAGEQPDYCGGLCPFYRYQEGGFNKIRTAPLWLARSGYIQSGSLNNVGNNGFYWSSTVKNSDNAYNLFFSAGSVSPANSGNRSTGNSIRCLAE